MAAMCNYTCSDLAKLLLEIIKAQNEFLFNSLFMPGTVADPKCKCGKSIREHKNESFFQNNSKAIQETTDDSVLLGKCWCTIVKKKCQLCKNLEDKSMTYGQCYCPIINQENNFGRRYCAYCAQQQNNVKQNTTQRFF